MKSLDIGGDAGYQALQCFIRTMVSKDVILIGKDLLLAQASTFLTDTDMTAKAFMVRKLNRPLLGFLTMNRVKEEPHMVRPVAE